MTRPPRQQQQRQPKQPRPEKQPKPQRQKAQPEPQAQTQPAPRQREVSGRRAVPDISTLIKKGDILLVQVDAVDGDRLPVEQM